MPWDRYVIGYHGCDRRIAESVISRKTNLGASSNDYDWLGNGIYFWEDSPERALQWAASTKVPNPAVIGAVINLGNCLNLTEAKNLETVYQAFCNLRDALKAEGKSLPKNSGKNWKARRLDCAVFESLHDFRKQNDESEFDTVRAFFIEGEPLYKSAGIRQLDHVQVCVRNPRMILGYFHPINVPHV